MHRIDILQGRDKCSDIDFVGVQHVIESKGVDQLERDRGVSRILADQLIRSSISEFIFVFLLLALDELLVVNPQTFFVVDEILGETGVDI